MRLIFSYSSSLFVSYIVIIFVEIQTHQFCKYCKLRYAVHLFQGVTSHYRSRLYNNPAADFIRLSKVRKSCSLMCLCIVILLFSSIKKKLLFFSYRGFYFFVVGTFQSLLKSVFTLIEDILVISESINYFVFRLYPCAFVTLHHNRSFSTVMNSKRNLQPIL